MKRICALILASIIVLDMAGCAGLAKKFTRKRKEPVKAPRFYKAREYKKEPSPDLYKKHYAYWMTWQSELIGDLGQNHKRDARCIEEIIGHLKDMQRLLTKEKADRLAIHIDRLLAVKDTIDREDLTQFNRDSIKGTLEREDRAIKREFYIGRVKDCLKDSSEDE